MDKIKILEVNNEDIIGRRFNGYEICENFLDSKKYEVRQIVLYKNSKKDFVQPFTDSLRLNYIDKLATLEQAILSTHNMLSISSEFLRSSALYKDCDIIHFHMYHNTRLSIYDLREIAKEKKIVISLHDPWWLSGKCVHAYDCEKWQEGCNDCPYLDSLFPMSFDNSASLWKLKRKVLGSIDATFLFPSKYIESIISKSNILKAEKREYLPFGVDTNFFKPKNKIELRKKYKINKDEIVISFRAQAEFKGTEYIIEALEKLRTDKKIKIFTIDQKRMLDKLKDKYEVVDLGIIDSNKLVEIYNVSDIFLSPSKAESFGFMIIEALACETPVVVFDNTSLPEVSFAPQCGVVAKNLDSSDLMLKIQFLIENTNERINRGQLGRKLVLKNYSLNQYYDRLEKIYDKASKGEFANPDYSYSESNKKDIRILKSKLKRVYKGLFNEKCKSSLLDGASIKYFGNKYKIDYSCDNVQELISNFNKLIFERLKEVDKIKRTPIKTFFNLLFFDQKKFIKTIKERIK